MSHINYILAPKVDLDLFPRDGYVHDYSNAVDIMPAADTHVVADITSAVVLGRAAKFGTKVDISVLSDDAATALELYNDCFEGGVIYMISDDGIVTKVRR
jgi:hypothetical protein